MKNKSKMIVGAVLMVLGMTISAFGQTNTTTAQSSGSSAKANIEVKGTCDYNGTSYSEGAHVCQSGWEYVCNGGSWESTGQKCDNDKVKLTSGQAVTKTAVFTTLQKGQTVEVDEQLGKAFQPQCVSFFYAGIGKVGIRNNCGECKIAVVNWTPTGGVRYYKVNGYDQTIVDVVSSTGQLIGEQPCK